VLPSISSDFNKSNQASWLGTSYLLAICTFTPLYGRLCNVLVRRGANQTAVIFAALGTLVCGLSNSMEMLIAARFIGGLGGGGILTTATIVISDMYSIRSRGLTQGVASVFNGLGMGLGGPLGGFVSDRFGWRWAFLMQMPLFFVSLALTQHYLHYTTPGKSKSAKEVLKRIDYGGSFTLLVAVGSFLVFLSTRYNDKYPWTDASVIVPLVIAILFAIAFVIVELFFAPEPVMAPFLLKQKIPVLVGMSNYLVALCNFSVMYFFPTWFQTVALTSASTAGLHLMPNSVSMSFGSMFAGWMMHRTGRYKLINLIFGCFPFIASILITMMKVDSPPAQLWLSIIPLGFGNAVVLQTMLIALIAHLPESSMAVGTGFGQLFRGLGQVSGVCISSALFQSKLDSELRKRIHTPDADQLIKQIRHSARLVATLPPDLQEAARDSYAISLKAVFTLAACSTFLAYIVRLPIPEKALEHRGRPRKKSSAAAPLPSTSNIVATDLGSSTYENPLESPLEPGDLNSSSDSDFDEEDHHFTAPIPVRPNRPRRLSTFEEPDAVMDLEGERIGGSARQ
jgi:MFS family permease